MELLDRTFYGNTLMLWATALGVAIGAYLALVLIKRLIVRNTSRLAKHTRTTWDDLIVNVLRRTRRWWLFAVALGIGSRMLDLTVNARSAIRLVLVFATVVQIGFWGRAIILGLIERHVEEQKAEDPGAATTMAALGLILQLLLWTVLLLMGLQNIGIEVAPLLAGLGVGGIAVALALQNILGDLFASLSIVLDKPFVIGDFIVVGDMAGNVEHVGLKTTRVRSLSGEQLIFSNSDLLSTRVRNFKRMWERRIVFRLGVIYQTPRDQVERIPGMLRSAVEDQDMARFDRAHFVAFGPSSLDFEVVFYVKSPEYGVYMDTQQAINLGIIDRFRGEDIEFAYPTQTLFIEKLGGTEA